MKDIDQQDLMVLRELRAVAKNPKLSVLDIISWGYSPDAYIALDGEICLWLPKCKLYAAIKKSDMGAA